MTNKVKFYRNDNNSIIVVKENGIEVDYGQLMKTRLPSGVEFVGMEWRLDRLLCLDVPVYPYKAVEEPFFYPHLTIEFYAPGSAVELSFWAVKQENVLEVAKELSKAGEVRITSFARILAILNGGEVITRSYLNDFYEDVTPEMLERCAF